MPPIIRVFNLLAGFAKIGLGLTLSIFSLSAMALENGASSIFNSLGISPVSAGILSGLIASIVLFAYGQVHKLKQKLKDQQKPATITTPEATQATKERLLSIDSESYNFNILNFQGIRQIQANLNFNAPWIFFTGYNGFGKTNILQAIARSLCPAKDKGYYNAINPQSADSLVLIKLNDHQGSMPMIADAPLPFRLMGYGASRLDMGSERSTKIYPSCASLFEPQVLLGNIEKEGLSRWYFKPKDRHKFDDCVAKFKRLIPNLCDIIVDEDSEVWYIEADHSGTAMPKISFKELASGYQNIISMVGDIILNLNKPLQQYEHESLKDNMKAVVVIDELELYLHPSWQKSLPQLLSDLFPNVLFIASTHSPMPLLGAPKGSEFYTVNRTAEDGITMTRLDDKIDIDELRPDTLLTSPLFGVEDIFASGYSGEKPVRSEASFDELKLRNLMDEKVKAFMSDE